MKISAVSFGNSLLRKDLTRNGGGVLAFLLQHSVQYRSNFLELVFSDPHKKCVVVAVKCGKAEVELLNMYITTF